MLLEILWKERVTRPLRRYSASWRRHIISISGCRESPNHACEIKRLCVGYNKVISTENLLILSRQSRARIAESGIRERPFHYGGVGWKTF